MAWALAAGSCVCGAADAGAAWLVAAAIAERRLEGGEGSERACVRCRQCCIGHGALQSANTSQAQLQASPTACLVRLSGLRSWVDVPGRSWRCLRPLLRLAFHLTLNKIDAPREHAGEVNRDQGGAQCVFLAPARPRPKLGVDYPTLVAVDTCVLLLMLDASRCHLQRKMAVDATIAR